MDIAGLRAAVIPYTPIPLVLVTIVKLLVAPPEIAKVDVENTLGPGTSEVNVRLFVFDDAVKSAKALLLFM